MKDNKYIINGDIIFHNQLFSNEEIKELVNKFVDIIIEKKFYQKKEIVGIAIERSPQLIAAILACLQCGVTFFPMDLEIPRERMEYMLEHAEVENIFVSINTKQLFENDYSVYYINSDENTKKITEDVIVGDNSAYILYTSGTTGKPKAVEIGRKSLFNFIEGMSQVIDFEKTCKIGCFTSCSFDIFFLESVMAIYLGLTIVLADEKERNNPRTIIKMIEEQSIDILQITPSKLKLLRAVDKKMEFTRVLRAILIGGEQFPEKILPLLQKNGKLKIYNMYGPTETTIWSMVADLSSAKFVHLGNPIKNTDILLLNDKMEKVQDSEEGYIYIGGDGVAKGYLREENVNNNRFIQYGELGRYYNTGDIGKYQNGLLFCLGRSDQQIKLNGNRIELDEIDYVINEIDGVEVSVTCYLPEMQKLVCFLKGNAKEHEIKDYVDRKLPKYMCPFKFIIVDEMIYSISGKIDRKSMLNKYNIQEEIIVQEWNDSVTEKIIEFFSEITSETITLDRSIGDYGIDSIEYVTFVVSVEEEYMIEFDDEMLIDTDSITLGDIVKLVKEQV